MQKNQNKSMLFVILVLRVFVLALFFKPLSFLRKLRILQTLIS